MRFRRGGRARGRGRGRGRFGRARRRGFKSRRMKRSVRPLRIGYRF